MAKNTSALKAPAKAKPKKMTKADFLVALDEINATLQRDIAEAREIQARTQASREKSEQLAKETRALLRAL